MRAFPLLLLALSSWVQAGPDPCTTMLATMSSNGFLSPSDVRPCYEQFAFDESLANETVAAVRSILENEYIFLEALANPPKDSGLTPMDILAEVKRARSMSHPTDMSFQEEISKALVKANDGHLSYDPMCYRTVSFFQPLFMTMVAGENNEAIVVIYTVDTSAEDAYSKYIGSTVVTIDGVDAKEALTTYANEYVGTCKDPETRLARTLSSTYFDGSKFVYNRGAFSKRNILPENDAVTYGILNPETKKITEVKIKWNGYMSEDSEGGSGGGASFTDTTSYMKAYCSPKAPKAPKVDPSIEQRNETTEVASTSLFLKQSGFPIPKMSIASARLKHSAMAPNASLAGTPSSSDSTNNGNPQAMNAAEDGGLKEPPSGGVSLGGTRSGDARGLGGGASSSGGSSDAGGMASNEELDEMLSLLKNITTPIVSGPGFGFFLLDDPVTVGVLAISTFDGTNSGLWMQQMAKGLRAFVKAGVKKLILDLTGNGGGTTCLSTILAALLDPAPDMPFPTPRMPFFTNLLVGSAVSQMGKAAASIGTQSPFLLTAYGNPETGRAWTDNDWSKFTTRSNYTLSDYASPVSSSSSQPDNILPRTYSRPLLDLCQAPGNPLADLVGKLPFAGPGNVAAMSDGYCGSACAVLLAHLQEVTEAKVLVTSATYATMKRNVFPSPWAFAGGAVTTVDQMLTFMQASGVPIPDRKLAKTNETEANRINGLPFSFPTNAEMRFTLRQAFSNSQPNTPLEFVRHKANGVLMVKPLNLMQPGMMWSTMAQYMEWGNNIHPPTAESVVIDKEGSSQGGSASSSNGGSQNQGSQDANEAPENSFNDANSNSSSKEIDMTKEMSSPSMKGMLNSKPIGSSNSVSQGHALNDNSNSPPISSASSAITQVEE
ncbi:MAG: hypothetical protein DHS80DRAFT_24717 [Piptocephalis tieghemiana]|nr:MAG: hypothetical protein DHS80DRAFT_24717 [Piptocephalis tieghemiana]